MMYSNYNILTLPMSVDGKYKVGDIYRLPESSSSHNWRFRKFNGLEIKYGNYI